MTLPVSPSPSVAGVIFAGGASRRFGGDKAAELLNGRMMIAQVATRLAWQVRMLALAGARTDYGLALPCLDDAPHKDKGPLAGLASAMRWARAEGYTHVLTAPCDVPKLPMNLLTLLGPPDDAPHVLAVDDRLEAACALWPVGLATQVEAQLTGDGKLSLTRALLDGKAVVRHVTARDLDGSFANINTPDDLDQLKTPNG